MPLVLVMRACLSGTELPKLGSVSEDQVVPGRNFRITESTCSHTPPSATRGIHSLTAFAQIFDPCFSPVYVPSSQQSTKKIISLRPGAPHWPSMRSSAHLCPPGGDEKQGQL